MSADGRGRLTDEQISELVTARRRTLRLRALRRLSASLRAAEAGFSGPAPLSPCLALPAPTSAQFAGPLFEALAASANATHAAPVVQPIRPPSPGPRLGAGAVIQDLPLAPMPVAIGARGAARVAGVWRRLPWPAIRERALVLVEICALVGLLIIVTGSFSGMGSPSAGSSGATLAAEPTTIPAAPEAELPGSSSPPAAGAEMPLPLRSLVRGDVPTPIPIPTPGPQAATRIVIPAIEVDSVVVEGDSWELLKKGVGHHLGTANPGERGNAVYAGHDDVFGEVFRRLEELKPGDLITLYAGQREFRYEVRRTRIVGATETSVMAPTPDATVTLITCYPYRIDTMRIIIIATLTE